MHIKTLPTRKKASKYIYCTLTSVLLSAQVLALAGIFLPTARASATTVTKLQVIELQISSQGLSQAACAQQLIANSPYEGGFVPVPALAYGPLVEQDPGPAKPILIHLDPEIFSEALLAKKKSTGSKPNRGEKGQRKSPNLPFPSDQQEGPAGYYDLPRDREDHSPTYGYYDNGDGGTGAAYMDFSRFEGHNYFLVDSFYTDPPWVRDSETPARGRRPSPSTDDRLPGGGSDRSRDSGYSPVYHDPSTEGGGYGGGDGPDPGVFGLKAILHLPDGSTVQGFLFQ